MPFLPILILPHSNKHLGSCVINLLAPLHFAFLHFNHKDFAFTVTQSSTGLRKTLSMDLNNYHTLPTLSHVPRRNLHIPAPASRGLCDECAQYNWQYHLTRHLPEQPKNALYRYEETLVEDMLEKDGRRKVNDRDRDYDAHYTYKVANAPYGGVYFVHTTGNAIMWKWESRQIMDEPGKNCSFCRLLASAARAAKVPLPVVSSVQCEFRYDKSWQYDPEVIFIRFGHENLDRAYMAGLRLTIEEGCTRDVVRTKLNCNQIDLEVIRLW
jgi:hypothetical protein